jgi:hypothetical protein
VKIAGVPVTILSRTLLDLTPLLKDGPLEVALDSAGRQRFGFLLVDELPDARVFAAPGSHRFGGSVGLFGLAEKIGGVHFGTPLECGGSSLAGGLPLVLERVFNFHVQQLAKMLLLRSVVVENVSHRIRSSQLRVKVFRCDVPALLDLQQRLDLFAHGRRHLDLLHRSTPLVVYPTPLFYFHSDSAARELGENLEIILFCCHAAEGFRADRLTSYFPLLLQRCWLPPPSLASSSDTHHTIRHQ